MSDLSRDPQEVAEERDQIVVYPNEHQLFIDIDDQASKTWLAKMYEVLVQNGIDFLPEKVLSSRSEGQQHVYISLDMELDDITRIAFQACMGSDRKRELLSLLRVVLKTKIPATVFFEDEVPT